MIKGISTEVRPHILLNDLYPGTEKSETTWYPEPHYQFTAKEGTTITGTFRSINCRRSALLGTFVDGCCHNCASIPTLRSFKKRILDRTSQSNGGHRDTTYIRNEFLTSEELLVKLKLKQESIEKKDSYIFFSKSKLLRLKIQVRSMKEKLTEFAKRGSMKNICKNLQQAAEENLLDDKNVLRDTLETVSRNLFVHKKGRRYKASTRLFYEVIMLWGGPRLATFVAMNLFGPEVHSIYRWRKQQSIHMVPGLKEDNFKKIADIYRGIMDIKGISRVPFQAAEDETAIVGKISYCQNTDMLFGFCGVKGEDHKCLDDFIVQVGDGAAGYNNVINAFEDYTIGTYARAIIINPLHEDLPRIPILIMPTCNKFNHEFVFRQWQSVEKYFESYLEPYLGTYIGPASDGDSRRRKLMLQLSLCPEGRRFRPLPEELGFVFSGRVDVAGDGSMLLRDLCDQDYVHNHKKLINCLDHASRVLMMGRYLVHMNHIHLLYNMFQFIQHGLSADDVNRRDRQNWRSAQKLSFLRVQHCLNNIVEGFDEAPPNPSVKGTLTYLKIVWHYVEIFCSDTATLEARVSYAATVAHFLAIWHNYIVQTPAMTKRINLIPRETYSDIILSCHFAVMLISYMRENYPELPCQLHLTGTDVVEEFWSRNGQWIGNRHNYTYGDLHRNLSHMIRLDEIRTDPNAPEFAKPHPKQEIIWNNQYPAGHPRANLTDYPSENDVVNAWCRGMKVARKMARDVGMGPDVEDEDVEGDDPDDDNRRHPRNQWFYQPFKDNIFKPDKTWDMDDQDGEENDDDSNSPRSRYHGGNGNGDESIARELVEEGLDMFETFRNNQAIDTENERNTDDTIKKHNLQLPVPGCDHVIHKSTLTEMLNEDPQLSKDRLKRVRQHQSYKGKMSMKGGENEISLFEDYVILARKEKTFSIGNVVRIQMNSVDYKKPVMFNHEKKSEITVTVNMYKAMDDTLSVYNMGETTVQRVKLTDVLSHVNMSVDDIGILHIPDTELSHIKETAEKIFQHKPSKTSDRVLFERRSAQFSDDGVSRQVVQPDTNTLDRVRRSKRTRTVLTFSD